MEAIISGQAGIAIIVDSEIISMIRIGHEEPTPILQADIPHILNRYSDLKFAEGLNLEQIRQELCKSKTQSDTLLYCIASMDADLSIKLRYDLAKLAEANLLKDDNEIAIYAENVFTACPFSERADIAGIQKLCKAENLECLGRLITAIERRQPAITIIHKAWKSIPLSVFGSQEEKQRFQSAAVRAGLFNVFSAEFGYPALQGNFLLASLQNHAILAFPYHRNVIKWWQELVVEF